MMTSDQWITAGIPLTAVVVAIIRNEVQAASFQAHISDLERQISTRISLLEVSVGTQFGDLRAFLNAKFEAQMQALLRVEGVLDARLKHLAENAKR